MAVWVFVYYVARVINYVLPLILYVVKSMITLSIIINHFPNSLITPLRAMQSISKLTLKTGRILKLIRANTQCFFLFLKTTLKLCVQTVQFYRSFSLEFKKIQNHWMYTYVQLALCVHVSNVLNLSQNEP